MTPPFPLTVMPVMLSVMPTRAPLSILPGWGPLSSHQGCPNSSQGLGRPWRHHPPSPFMTWHILSSPTPGTSFLVDRGTGHPGGSITTCSNKPCHVPAAELAAISPHPWPVVPPAARPSIPCSLFPEPLTCSIQHQPPHAPNPTLGEDLAAPHWPF